MPVLPLGSMALPLGSMALPLGSMALPLGSMALPLGSVALPLGSVALPLVSMTLPLVSVALPLVSVALPLVSMTLPLVRMAKKPSQGGNEVAGPTPHADRYLTNQEKSGMFNKLKELIFDMSNDEIVSGFDANKDDSLKIDLIKITEVENGLVLVLNGYIDTYNSNSLQRRVSSAIEAGYVRLVFDCTNLNYVSSTGIGSFTSFLKSLKAINGDLVLQNVQAKVYDVFQLLGFAQFFNIRDSREEAIAFFRGAGTAKTGPVFPFVFSCPICQKKLKAAKSGRFRCSECKTILAIDEDGNFFLG
jgi:anti-anti-sigma factor